MLLVRSRVRIYTGVGSWGEWDKVLEDFKYTTHCEAGKFYASGNFAKREQ